MEAVRLEIKDVGEGAEGVDFIVLECVEVEADPLKMHDKNVGRRCNHCALLQVDLPVAAVALVVVDDFALDQLLERLFD